jgi:hypothetical protein
MLELLVPIITAAIMALGAGLVGYGIGWDRGYREGNRDGALERRTYLP